MNERVLSKEEIVFLLSRVEGNVVFLGSLERTIHLKLVRGLAYAQR